MGLYRSERMNPFRLGGEKLGLPPEYFTQLLVFYAEPLIFLEQRFNSRLHSAYLNMEVSHIRFKLVHLAK